jgi:hypothetical protein
MQSLLFFAHGARPLYFPCLLLIYYVACRLLVARNQKIGSIVPQYEPPEGITPVIARYILTGGIDGTTLAAALGQLAAGGVLSIQPIGRSYLLKTGQAGVLIQSAGRLGALGPAV